MSPIFKTEDDIFTTTSPVSRLLWGLICFLLTVVLGMTASWAVDVKDRVYREEVKISELEQRYARIDEKLERVLYLIQKSNDNQRQ